MPRQTCQTEPEDDFHAVAESRQWKEAVARETAGMTMAERMAYFRRHSSVEAIRRRASIADSTESCVVREDDPKG